MAELFPRGDRGLIVEALGDTRGVFVLGARQVGKSTLAREIARDEHPAQIISLDDKASREAALADPVGFIAGLRRPVFIDEVQRGSDDLLLAIKAAMDSNLSPGQFLLTGSANFIRNRKVSDALTGRIDLVRLWPLAQTEIERSSCNFVDEVFAGSPPGVTDAPVGRDALAERIAAGGYPEARLRSGRRQARWFTSYLRTTFEKDLDAITDAHKLHEMPKILRLLASQSANLLVPTAIARKLDLDHRTVEHYVGLLEVIYLVKRIPAWSPGFGQREIQHPKVHIADSGLLLHLLGANEHRLLNDDQVTGKALESFVAMEIVKHLEWSDEAPSVYHYRRKQDEIDLVLENRAGDIVAIEVKAAASMDERDWRSLAKLRDRRSKNFKCGIVVYTGAQTIPLGDRLFAMPLSGLWA